MTADKEYGNSPWRDSETLEELYHGQDMTQAEIADRFGCSQKTVSVWLDKFELRNREARGKGNLTASDTPCPFYTLPASNSETNAGVHYEVWQDTKNGKRVRHHRLVAVAEYGFDAVKGKDIHHKNGIGWDNRLCNLEVLTPEEHRRHHAEEQWGASDD